jgi:hypothetical protein
MLSVVLSLLSLFSLVQGEVIGTFSAPTCNSVLKTGESFTITANKFASETWPTNVSTVHIKLRECVALTTCSQDGFIAQNLGDNVPWNGQTPLTLEFLPNSTLSTSSNYRITVESTSGVLVESCQFTIENFGGGVIVNLPEEEAVLTYGQTFQLSWTTREVHGSSSVQLVAFDAANVQVWQAPQVYDTSPRNVELPNFGPAGKYNLVLRLASNQAILGDVLVNTQYQAQYFNITTPDGARPNSWTTGSAGVIRWTPVGFTNNPQVTASLYWGETKQRDLGTATATSGIITVSSVPAMPKNSFNYRVKLATAGDTIVSWSDYFFITEPDCCTCTMTSTTKATCQNKAGASKPMFDNGIDFSVYKIEMEWKTCLARTQSNLEIFVEYNDATQQSHRAGLENAGVLPKYTDSSCYTVLDGKNVPRYMQVCLEDMSGSPERPTVMTNPAPPMHFTGNFYATPLASADPQWESARARILLDGGVEFRTTAYEEVFCTEYVAPDALDPVNPGYETPTLIYDWNTGDQVCDKGWQYDVIDQPCGGLIAFHVSSTDEKVKVLDGTESQCGGTFYVKVGLETDGTKVGWVEQSIVKRCEADPGAANAYCEPNDPRAFCGAEGLLQASSTRLLAALATLVTGAWIIA